MIEEATGTSYTGIKSLCFQFYTGGIIIVRTLMSKDITCC